MSFNRLRIATMFSCAAILAACGGGGGADSPAPAPGLAPAPSPGPVASVPLITSPIAPPVGTDAEALAAWNTLNDQRSQCGFGKLNWNAALETAAAGHANWAILNNYTGHFQVAATPGFTGVSYQDRYVAAGLSDFTGTDEILAIFGSNSKTGRGNQSARLLLGAPYHALGLLDGHTNIGISVKNATEVGSLHGARVTSQYNLLYQNATGPQKPTGAAANAVRTYPCSGVTGTERLLDGETPNPVPGRDLLANPVGHPVMVEAVNSAAALVIASASITPTAGGSSVTLLPNLTQTSDANGIVRTNQAVLIPNLPLLANTSYTVSITGTVNGTAFSTNFSWTTGN
jgi:uncharacterized protein YkwD